MFQLKLLPNFFKKIAVMILLIDFIFLFLTKSDVLVVDLMFTKTLLKMGLILAGFIWIFSKLKIENEQTSRIRFQSFLVSFIALVTTFFVEPIVGFIFEGNISGFKFESSAFSLVFKALVFYIIIFNSSLRKLKNKY